MKFVNSFTPFQLSCPTSDIIFNSLYCVEVDQTTQTQMTTKKMQKIDQMHRKNPNHLLHYDIEYIDHLSVHLKIHHMEISLSSVKGLS